MNTTIPALLADIPLFSGLDADERERIAGSTREIRAARGETLFCRGDACTGFHLLLSGRIKLAFPAGQCGEKVVAILEPGQSFGEALMFMGKPYIVSAQALSKSRLLHISSQAVFDELVRDKPLRLKMLLGMARRLHQLIADIEAYSLQSGKQRAIGYFLGEVPEAQRQDNQVSLTLPVTKGLIASRLNLTQEHFSRILQELGRLGLIVVAGRTIHIPSLSNLRNHEG